MPNQSDQNSSQPIAPPINSQPMDLPPLPQDFSAKPVEQPADQPTNTSQSTTPPDLPPVVTPPKKKFGGGKIIATILAIFLLVGGVGAGILVTQQPQIFQGKAWIPEWGGDPNEDPNKPGNEEDPEKEEEWIPDQNELPTYTGDTQTDPLNCGSIGNACDSGDSCAGGVCISGLNTDCGRQNDPGAPGCCSRTCVGEIVCEPGAGGGRKECKSSGGQHCTIETQSADCSGVNPGEPPDNPSSPPPTSSAQCLAVKAYSATWNVLDSAGLSALSPGDIVNFCVAGSATSGSFDKAQFKIGSTVGAETTTKGQGTAANDFCQSYTILAADTTINVKAKIHHIQLNQWVGETF